MRTLAALGAAAVVCAAAELPRGVVIDPVVCRGDAHQSYALYLPSTYTPERAWPVLYCFDAGARGGLAVERFREGAERYGYIVAGSNNSRNGPFEASFRAAAAMWEDTHGRFRIEGSRRYGAGFSGGARMLSGLAARTGAFAGMILCGAGLSPALKVEAVAWPVFGTAGLEDFNYFELRRLDRALDRSGTPHRIEIFEGGHDWPPSELAARALEWFDLAAMKAGTRARDQQWVRKAEERLAEAARKSEAAGEVAAAQAGYAALAADLKGLAEVGEYERKAAELARSSELRRAEKRENGEAEEYERLTGEAQRLAQQDDDPGALSRWIAVLRRQSEKAQDAAARRQARRVLAGLFVHARSMSGELLNGRDYRGAARWLEIDLELRGGRPLAEYQLACAYAQAGERQRALGAWRRALRDGFGYYLFFASWRR